MKTSHLMRALACLAGLALGPAVSTLSAAKIDQDKVLEILKASDSSDQLERKLADWTGPSKQQKLEVKLIYAVLRGGGVEYFEKFRKEYDGIVAQWDQSDAFYFKSRQHVESKGHFFAAQKAFDSRD